MYSYEDYLADFYETLRRRQGITLRPNTIAAIYHSILQPMTREQFLEWSLERYIEATEPLARAGFNYLKRTSRGGRKSAQVRWGDQGGQRSRIEQAAITLLKSHPRRGLAQRIKQRCGLSLTVQRINAILKSSGI